ncbi:MAG: hypothetical protein ACO1SX_10695 [Actinomycetota bacterium]
MSYASANLLWQHRYRGLMAGSHHSVGDDGRCLVIKADERERRTYQLLDIQLNGAVSEVGAVSVETVSKFDGLPGGALVVGMTANDIYVFRDGRKARFMPDRRVTYTDLYLAPLTQSFACAFSDPVFSVHGLAFGDVSGRLAWTRDLTSAPNCVAVSENGRIVAAGTQDGRLLAMDNLRSPLWECVQDEPVTALALPAAGACPVAGALAGTVMALDEDGGFRWRTPTPLPIIAVATDADGFWVAAAASDDAVHRITCFDRGGGPVWEHDLEWKPSGVSLSPNGRRLLVSTVSGAVSLFDVDLAAAAVFGMGRGRRRLNLDLARSAADAGDLAGARELLLSVLEPAPHDLEAAAALAEVERALVDRLRSEAQSLAKDGHPLEALALLDEALQLAPWNAEVFAERLDYRNQALSASRARAEALEAAEDRQAAQSAWLDAIQLDPTDLTLREALARARAAESLALQHAGDQLRSAGDLDGAIVQWQRALSQGATAELRDRLEQGEVERSVAAGIALYEEQRLPEAAFQLRKALALAPNHETAQRYLGYTQSATTDTLIADRFTRLE